MVHSNASCYQKGITIIEEDQLCKVNSAGNRHSVDSRHGVRNMCVIMLHFVDMVSEYT